MRISELRARELLKLKSIGCVATACELGDMEFYNVTSYRKERCVDVEHRDLSYVVGCWAGWEGAFWVVECRTGWIFRETSVKALRDIISLCSAAYYEPNEVR